MKQQQIDKDLVGRPSRYNGTASYRAKPRFESVDEYLASARKETYRILDNGEVRRIGDKCGLHSEEVRGALRRLGFTLTERKSGVREWRRPTKKDLVLAAGADIQNSSSYKG